MESSSRTPCSTAPRSTLTTKEHGRIELVDLNTGVAWRYKANTTAPRAVLLPEIRLGLILQSGGATQTKYLDQK